MIALAVSTLRARWVSFAGAFVALVAGVAIMVAMLLTLNAAFTTASPGPQRFAGAPVVVVPNSNISFNDGDGGVDEESLSDPAPLPTALLARLSALGRTVQDRTFSVYYPGGSGDQVGHGWSAAALGGYRLIAGRAPASDRDMVIAGDSAALVGQWVDVATPAGTARYLVSGVVRAQWFENAVFFTDSAAARIDPEVTAAAVDAPAAAVSRVVGSSAEVLTGTARDQADPDPSEGGKLLSGTQITAGTAAAVICSVAVFVVVATFAFVADLRRREMALLRLAGATSDQMARLIAGEGLLIGLAGSLAGCVAGAFGGGLAGRALVSSGVAPQWFTVGFSWWPVLAGLAAGVLSALAGSAATAWRAGRVAPAEALREAAVDNRVMTPFRWVLGAAALIGALVSVGYTLNHSAFEMTNLRKIIEIPLLFTGTFAVLVPVLAAPLARVITRPLGRLGTVGMIVQANTVTAARRTAATAGAVVVAAGLAAGFFVLQDNAQSAMEHQVTDTIQASYVVLPENGNAVNQATVAALHKVASVQAVPVGAATIYIGTRGGELIDGLNAQVIASGSLAGVEDPAVVSGSLRSFGPASLVVDEKTAQEDDLATGQQLAVWGPDGAKRDVTVAAIVRTGLTGDLAYVSSAAVDEQAVGRVDIRILPGTSDATALAALRAALAGQQATLATPAQTAAALTSSVHDSSSTTTLFVLGVALLYALAAVANTMVMATAGRRRELAALNLVGTTRGQLLCIVAAESLVAVVIGTVVAALAGLCVLASQWIALFSMAGTFPVTVPWGPTGVVVGACAVIGVVAAACSAVNAMRGRTVELVAQRE